MKDDFSPDIVDAIESDDNGVVNNQKEAVKMKKTKNTYKEQMNKARDQYRAKNMADELNLIEIELPSDLAVKEMSRFISEKLDISFYMLDDLTIEVAVTEEEAARIEKKLVMMERHLGFQKSVVTVTRTVSDGITAIFKTALPAARIGSAAISSTFRAAGTTAVKAGAIGLQEAKKGYASMKEDLDSDPAVQEAKESLRGAMTMGAILFGRISQKNKKSKELKYSQMRQK